MKKKLIFGIATTISIILYSCSKDETCTFDSTFLNGKSFKVTKKENIINGVSINTTDTSACKNNILTLTATTFYSTIAAGCLDPAISGTYTVTNESGKNYLNVSFIGGSQKLLISKADCSSFVTNESDTFGSSITVTSQTFTKQ